MQTTLLSTKLYVPSTRDTLIARPRLLAVLSSALGKGFTLISAPAGYGKTTLVSSWLHERALPCAWLSLEESDNDPVRFLQYLLTALQVVVQSVRTDLLDLVDESQPASFQGLVNVLINKIADQELHFVLVLDDFHLIQDQHVLDIVAFLLEHLPGQRMQLVIITRADPPLALSRLRVRNQMVEIRAEQLRFTQPEVVSFVNGMGFTLTDEDMSALYRRTEGWIAGLQLAGLSMQGCADLPGFIAAFSGSHHYILDYLADEVLKRQDERVRSFLMQTCILSRMCASLCESLLDATPGEPAIDGQSMLETLERRNLFIIPLDGERRWYRYHYLFANALSRRLEYQYPQLLPLLYRRASIWYENNGLIGEAIQYALNAGDKERAAQLVEQNGCYLLMSGELITLLKWMDSVEPYFFTYPQLVIQKGWALTLAGRMEPAEQAFQLAEQLVSTLPPSPDVSSKMGTISAGRAYWADIQGKVSEAARLAQQALDSLPDTDPLSQSMRSVATGALAKTYLASGELDHAKQIFERAVEIGRAADSRDMIINNNNDIAEILFEQGQLGQAEQLSLNTLPLTLRPDGQRLPTSVRIYSALSTIYYERNMLEQANYYAQQCLEVGPLWGHVDEELIGMIISARVEHARGDSAKAGQWLESAERLYRENRIYTWKAIQIEAALDRLSLSLGNHERVSRRLEAAGVNPSGEIIFRYEIRYVTLLRLLLARGENQAALTLVERMLPKARQDCRTLRLVELLVLQSIAYQGLKDLDAAVTTLSQAVSLAQPERYIRTFLDEGPGLLKLLYLVKSSYDTTGFAGELLSAYGPAAAMLPQPGQLLVEPLSGREIEVLRLIEAGLSNQDIASQLFISITTVKRHISNIYSKLGVNTRTQAVSRAKQLGYFDAV